MSKRSHSPHHRFSFKEPRLDCYKGLKLDKDRVGRRDDHPHRLDFLREDLYPGGHRRSPVFPDDHHRFMHYNHSRQEELHHRRPPPRYDGPQTLSSPHHRDEDRDGHREGSKGSNSWVRSPKSPPRIQREELASRFHSDQQREARMGKRRDKQGGGWEKFRDLSPSSRAQNWESGWERGRRSTQSSDRERQREDPHRDRSPVFRRQRRKLEDVEEQNGFRGKEGGEQHYAARETSGRSGPLVVEHDHGFRPRNPSREGFDGAAVARTRTVPPAERYRRSEEREEAGGRPDDGRTSSYPEARRNPGGKSTVMASKLRGKSSFHAGAQGGRAAAPRSQVPGSSQSFSERPHQDQRAQSGPFLEDDYKKATNSEADGPGGSRSQAWTDHRAPSLDPPPPGPHPDPRTPRQRMAQWSRPKAKNVTVVAEETLTIKVDMNQPLNKTSVPCSSDRQLSLDLVNVGRQRLDFLPLLEHSGSHRQSPGRSGTFAQEIITLVHHVKERYFGGRGITLNQRFSAGRKATPPEGKEPEKLTLNQRFSSNRGCSLHVSSVLEEQEPAFSSLLQPVRGPGDLRHDLERRRQERTEGVKITITGGRPPQRPLEPASEPSSEYRDDEDQMEPEGFSHLPAQHRTPEFNMGSRRGGPHRPFKAFQRVSCGVGNQFRLIRRQKHNFQVRAPDWTEKDGFVQTLTTRT